jgi:hypothetical protein
LEVICMVGYEEDESDENQEEEDESDENQEEDD